MSSTSDQDILARLVGKSQSDVAAEDPWASLEATEPAHETTVETHSGDDPKLTGLLQRISQLTSGEETDAERTPRSLDGGNSGDDAFVPKEPCSLREAGLTDSEVESLVLKALLSRGDVVGRDIADQIKLPFLLVEEVLRQLKHDQLVVYRGSAAMNDYVYQLTDLGRERARRHAAQCTYFGSAPVALADYIESVKAQSLENQHPTPKIWNGPSTTC